MSRYLRCNLLDQTLQYSTWSTFCEVGSTISDHILNSLCPAYRSCQLSYEILLDLFRISVRQCIYILINRTFGSVYFSSVDSCFQFNFCRIHQRRVESAADSPRPCTVTKGGSRPFSVTTKRVASDL